MEHLTFWFLISVFINVIYWQKALQQPKGLVAKYNDTHCSHAPEHLFDQIVIFVLFFSPLMWSLFCIAFKWCHVAHYCVNLCMLTHILLFVLNIVIMHMSIFSEQVFFLGTNDCHHFWNLHHYLSPKKWHITLSLPEIGKQHIRYRRNRFSWASADVGSHENLCLVPAEFISMCLV